MPYKLKTIQGELSTKIKAEHRAFAPLMKPAEISNNVLGEMLTTATKDLFFLRDKLDMKNVEKNTGEGTTVAIIDTGVNAQHVDLQGKVIASMDHYGKTGNVDDQHGHGTHLAGLIAGKNSEKFKDVGGIAPEAKIVSIKVTNDRGGSETSWWKISAALNQVIEFNSISSNPKITAVLLSYNAFDNNTSFIPKHHIIYQQFIKLFKNNIPVIVSGGNQYREFYMHNDIKKVNGLAYPANCPYIISAGAYVDNNKDHYEVGELAPFTQRFNFKQFFLAPGCNTISCWCGGADAYSTLSGSSQAAAITAGLILLLQQNTPGANITSLQTSLRNSATFNLPAVARSGNINESRRYPHVNII